MSQTAPHTGIHQWMCLILLKVEQSAFTQAFSFSSLSDVHECSRMAFKWPHPLLASSGQPTMNHHMTAWLMSLAMDLAALCDKWR